MSYNELYVAAAFMVLGLFVILSGNVAGKGKKWVVYRLWTATILAVIGLTLLTLFLNGFNYF